MRIVIIIAFLQIFIPLHSLAQRSGLTIASYNLENLFDTLNDPGIHDMVLTSEKYEAKVYNLARVIGELQPDVLALCEVENAGVLQDMLDAPPLDRSPYRFIHYDSPDTRGIDVALIYRTDRLTLLHSEPIAAPHRYPTRDMLRAEFTELSTGQKLAVYAVHLPSRRGGSGKAARMRELIAAQLADCIDTEERTTNVIAMGDFNDNPSSKLFRRYLSALHCTTAAAYRRGLGSYAWRDTWQMYDNIFVSRSLEINGDARIFVRPWMLTPQGRFRDYPYRGAFSDHLPVFIRATFGK